jgi:hypothetical protein
VIRINKWHGLVTAASPYILPPGAAVEQVNAQSRTPGQLTVRGGMASVSTTVPVLTGLLEAWGYCPGAGDSDKVFVLDTAGDLDVLTIST